MKKRRFHVASFGRLEITAMIGCLLSHYPPLACEGSTLIHVLMDVSTVSAFFEVEAIPLSYVTIHGSVYRLPCEQYRGANPLRATFPQHPLTLRVLEWLHSANCEALRHFHHVPATTLHCHFLINIQVVSCSGGVLPMFNAFLGH